MNLIGHLILSLIPGGGFIHYALSGLFHLVVGNGFQHGFKTAKSNYVAFQQRLEHDWTDNVIVVWFLFLLTGYFLPFTQGYVEAGFTSMTASLPPSMQENFHIIVLAVFGVNTTKTAIKKVSAHYTSKQANGTTEEDPTKHFLFKR